MKKLKNTIWQKLLFFVAVPCLAVLGLILFCIVYSVYESKVNLANQLLVNKTSFNSERLKFTLDSIRLTLESGAELLSRIDTTRPDAREQAERIIRQTLRNRNIYNVRLVYEADAFDGKDSDDRYGYPGAPSGRFIRSYINDDGTILVAPHMDEDTIDDPQESPWYTDTIKSKKPHISIDETIVYDHNDEKTSVYSISIPLFRDGLVIGCLGANGSVDELFGGLDEKTSSSIFSESLHNTGTLDGKNIGRFIDALEFADSVPVENALRDKKAGFFRNARFDGGSAMVSLAMIQLEPFGELTWVVTALPRSSIYASMYLVIAVAIMAMLFFSILLLLSLRYVALIISKPIRAMSGIAEDLNSEGQKPMMLPEHDFGRFAISFQQMMTVFHTRIDKTNWQQEMLDFYLFLESALFPGADLSDFFRNAAERFVSVYQATGATLRIYGAGDRETVSRPNLKVGTSSPQMREPQCSTQNNCLAHPAINGEASSRHVVIHYDPVLGFGTGNEDLDNWQTALRASLQSADRTGMVWRDIKGNSEENMTVCAFPLRVATGELAGGIFLSFDTPLSEEAELHAVFMAEQIAHLLADQEMSLG
ncbi:MAG: cache domain-containing protein [Betaproteobacteria bacterium]|nr:cache domain-containing protein [Betaproteobacteria bacterium]